MAKSTKDRPRSDRSRPAAATAASPVTYITPREVVADRVIEGRGLTLSTIESRAANAVAGLQADFLWDAEVNLEKLNRLLAEGPLAGDSESAGRLSEIQMLVHEIRGQSGTFGYDLATAIGTSLFYYIEGLGEERQVQPRVVEIHVEALKSVILGRISGHGGDRGRALLAGIEAVVAKLTAD